MSAILEQYETCCAPGVTESVMGDDQLIGHVIDALDSSLLFQSVVVVRGKFLRNAKHLGLDRHVTLLYSDNREYLRHYKTALVAASSSQGHCNILYAPTRMDTFWGTLVERGCIQSQNWQPLGEEEAREVLGADGLASLIDTVEPLCPNGWLTFWHDAQHVVKCTYV